MSWLACLQAGHCQGRSGASRARISAANLKSDWHLSLAPLAQRRRFIPGHLLATSDVSTGVPLALHRGSSAAMLVSFTVVVTKLGPVSASRGIPTVGMNSGPSPMVAEGGGTWRSDASIGPDPEPGLDGSLPTSSSAIFQSGRE